MSQDKFAYIILTKPWYWYYNFTHYPHVETEAQTNYVTSQDAMRSKTAGEESMEVPFTLVPPSGKDNMRHELIRKLNPDTLLMVVVENGMVVVENSWWFLNKLQVELQHVPASALPVPYPKGLKTRTQTFVLINKC